MIADLTRWCVEAARPEMAEATIASDKWVLDADLEEQKEQQTLKVLYYPACFAC